MKRERERERHSNNVRNQKIMLTEFQNEAHLNETFDENRKDE